MSKMEEQKITVGDRVGIRNFISVVDAVKASIPKLYPNYPEIRVKLTALQVRSQRRSSEDGHEGLWEEGAIILSSLLGDLNCSWKKKTYSIWAKRK